MSNCPKIIIGGTGSGCGKTSITIGILKALKDRGNRVCAFKCGPDYIDPMFASKVIGIKSRNLDPYMISEKDINYLIHKNTEGYDIAIIEGVMGIYDGREFSSDKFSTNHLALMTQTPEVLVVNVKGKAFSVIAEINGYLNERENNIKAVILNNCSKGMYPVYKNAIEMHTNIKAIGFMPVLKEASIESRHLGLVTAEEMNDLNRKIEILGESASENIELDELFEIATNFSDEESACSDNSYEEYNKINGFISDKRSELNNLIDEKNEGKSGQGKIKIAVARDKAFCFIYEDNIDLLRELGAEIEYFSPLEDGFIPRGISALYLPGGYPELYLEELSQNSRMKKSILEALDKKMPLFAECGGFMYLGNSISDGCKSYDMVGAIDSDFKMTSSLVRFGYKELIARKKSLMAEKGDSIKCHEFHYSDGTNVGDSFTAKRGKREELAVFGEENLMAGYPHIHFWSNINFPIELMKSAINFYNKNKE